MTYKSGLMLEIKNLCVKYKGAKKEVLDKISFSVKKGEIIALLGPSGCGKTTILNIVAGLLGEKEVGMTGSVLLNGGNGARVNMVFQSPTLLPWRSVESNIVFGLEIKKIKSEESKQMAREAIKMVGLEGFEGYLPNKLSIGMQQRVNFARALACRPELLLMDEPFSALDKETKTKIQEEFLKIIKQKEMTTLFVTHSIEEAIFLADKVVILEGQPSSIKDIFENKGNFFKTEKAVSLLEFHEE